MAPLVVGILASACLSTAVLAIIVLRNNSEQATLPQRECCADLWASDALTCKDGTPCPLFEANIVDTTAAVAIGTEALIGSEAPLVSLRQFTLSIILLFVAIAAVIICRCSPFHRRQCDENAAQAATATAEETAIEDGDDKGVSESAASPGDVPHSDAEACVPLENGLGDARAPAVARAEARARAVAEAQAQARAVAEAQAVAEAVEEAAAAAEAAATAVAIAEAQAQAQAQEESQAAAEAEAVAGTTAEAQAQAESQVEAGAVASSPDDDSTDATSLVPPLENGLHTDVGVEETLELGIMDAATIAHQNSGNSAAGTTGTRALASESGVVVDDNALAILSENVNGSAGAVAAVSESELPVDATAAAAVMPTENGEVHPRT